MSLEYILYAILFGFLAFGFVIGIGMIAFAPGTAKDEDDKQGFSGYAPIMEGNSGHCNTHCDSQTDSTCDGGGCGDCGDCGF